MNKVKWVQETEALTINSYIYTTFDEFSSLGFKMIKHNHKGYLKHNTGTGTISVIDLIPLEEQKNIVMNYTAEYINLLF